MEQRPKYSILEPLNLPVPVFDISSDENVVTRSQPASPTSVSSTTIISENESSDDETPTKRPLLSSFNETESSDNETTTRTYADLSPVISIKRHTCLSRIRYLESLLFDVSLQLLNIEILYILIKIQYFFKIPNVDK